MPFWSSQTLERRLATLISTTTPAAIDCNAITLTVGPEVYITPSLEGNAYHSHTKKALSADEGFAIPPGQFAFLLTEEVVSVPPTAMAFISMKATFKLKGLVNVSGFHVDPGWSGRLIFAVFNAGPSAVHLQRGLPLFLIWYADLDEESTKRKTGKGFDLIPPQMINNITGAVDSLYALDTRLRDETKKLSDRIHDVEKNQRATNGTLLVLGAIVVGLLGAAVTSHFSISPPQANPAPVASPEPAAPTPAAPHVQTAPP